MKKIQLLISLCLLLSVKVMAQQDAQFSQYMFNGLYINPAYAGFKQNLNINTFYRTQWSGFEGAPKTMTLSVDAPLADNTMGLGFQVASDRIGITDELAAYGIYSYRLQVNDEAHLAFGLGVGFYRFAFNGGSGVVTDPTDELYSDNKSSSFNPEVKFGLFFNTEKFYVGLSANNLLSPYLKSDPDASTLIPRKSTQIYLTSGVAVPLSENVVMKPSFLLKQDIKGYSTLDLNTFFLFYDRVWVGAAYRSSLKLIDKQPNQPSFNSNAAILMTELFLGEKFRLGYAYDMSLGAVKDLNASAHEISLSYSLDVENLFPPSSPAPRPVRAVTEKADNRAEKEAARTAEKEAKQKERDAKEAERKAEKEAKEKQKAAEVKEVPKATVVETPKEEKKEKPVKEKPVKEKKVEEKPVEKPVEQPKEEKKEEKPVKPVKEKPVKEKKVEEKPVETPKEDKVDTKAAEREAAKKAEREAADAEKAQKAEAKEREKAEAKERAEEEKREKEAKRAEEQKEREAQKERERAEAAEKAAEKAKEREDKAKAEQAKEVETAQQREERRQAEKEEAKRIKKLKRQKGAMITPRYF